MAKITYIEHNGKPHVVDIKSGMSLMEGGVKNDVPGIDAECGGACACATCLVYIDEPWLRIIGEPQLMEQSMLEFAKHPRPGCRLSCQIPVTEQLDGLTVRLPESQS
jgi:2Fe-2S ferredoxin